MLTYCEQIGANPNVFRQENFMTFWGYSKHPVKLILSNPTLLLFHSSDINPNYFRPGLSANH